MATLEVRTRARDHVADVDRLAGFRIRHKADISPLVLEIEHRGDRVRGT